MVEALSYVCKRFSIAIVAVVSVVMLLAFLSVEANITRIGYFGVAFRGNSEVVDVQIPEGILQSGDQIDLTSLTPAERFSLLGAAPIGAQMNVRAIRNGRSFVAPLRAVAPSYARQVELTRDIGIPICFVFSLGLASALFLMRPGPATLAFYGYAVLMLLKVYQTPLYLAEWPMNLYLDLGLQIVYPLTQLAILVFARLLFGSPGRAWPWIIWPAVATSVVVFLLWSDQIVWTTTLYLAAAGSHSRILDDLADLVLLVMTICGLAYIASGVERDERARMSWIVLGLAIAPVLDMTWDVADIASVLVRDTSTMLLAIEDWTDALLPWAGLCGIVTVFYGLLSRRVIDIRIAIGRAALYGTTTLVILVFFGAIEWLAEQIFESTRPAMYVSLIAALAIGFAMRTVHGRLETLVDAIFFKSAHEAEDSLRRAARAVANTTSRPTVVEFLLDEPVTVLDLTAAALFLADGEGQPFARVAERGWGAEHAASFGAEDVLPVMLRAELGPIALDSRRRAELQLPGGDRIEAMVVPLIMRGRLFGFAFYGERSDGAAFTALERELLAAIATNASSAFDHIDAENSRRRIADLEARLASLKPSKAS
jgi:hypothetical protein